MGVVREALFVAFELPCGVRLGAFWNGGRMCDVYALNGRFGPLVERWRMVDSATGEPRIEYHHNALRELVNWRCADRVAVRQMTARYWAAVKADKLVAKRRQFVPEFSAN